MLRANSYMPYRRGRRGRRVHTDDITVIHSTCLLCNPYIKDHLQPIIYLGKSALVQNSGLAIIQLFFLSQSLCYRANASTSDCVIVQGGTAVCQHEVHTSTSNVCARQRTSWSHTKLLQVG